MYGICETYILYNLIIHQGYKFMQLKLGGSYKGAVVTPQNEIHESWIDFIGKEFTVVYSGDKITWLYQLEILVA